MQDIYQTFEFYKIQDAIKDICHTERGKEYASNIKMLTSFEAVKTSLEELSEVYNAIKRFGNMPIHSSSNAIRLIEIAKKTAILTCKDLDAIAEDVLTLAKINSYIKKLDDSFPLIKDKCAKFFDLTNLEKEIHRVINSSLVVVDNATPELHEIRKKLKKLEASVIAKGSSLAIAYSEYLNDENPTLRDGHFVLPVKTAYKSKVNGIIYDVSTSGNTTFIEPLEMVNLNNEITALKINENEEIRKILKALTNMVLLSQNEVLTNNEIIAELDFLSAKVNYGLVNEMNIASLTNKQEISLVEARHPLLDVNKVISNSYYASEEKRIVIISGPNAGGKTVSLKTIGLLILMNQSGLMIPVKEAKLGYYKHIYLDIGDNQSLSDNLSTFSAHISNIAKITNQVGGKDIVLIDELGTGTDPKEGEALALAIIKALEKKHPICFISSHFSSLKEYAFKSAHIENSSMIFDEKELKPTYIFKSGVPGKSYAIEVASRYELSEEIINDAKSYLTSHTNTDSEALIKTLQDKVRENTLLLEELNKREKELAKKEKMLEADTLLLKEKRAHLLESVKQEKEALLNEAKKEIQVVLDDINKQEIKMHEVISARKRLDELKETSIDEEFNEPLKVGDYVLSPSLDIQGKILAINGKKAKVSSSSGLVIDISQNKLTRIPEPKQKENHNSYRQNIEIKPNVGLKLNLIGLHVDEARNKLIRYLDEARMHNYKTVTIIHGFGSGALRKMTHEYLSSLNVSYRLGGEYEGGSGTTVVTFND